MFAVHAIEKFIRYIDKENCRIDDFVSRIIEKKIGWTYLMLFCENDLLNDINDQHLYGKLTF